MPALHADHINRRQLLRHAAWAATATQLPRWAWARQPLGHDPFGLGVASGEPLPDGVVLWTRLLPRDPADAGAPALSGRRARIVYKLTPEGKDRFQEWLVDAGPEAYEDELFGVHLAFFSRTDRDIRLRILLGRRNRLEERLATLRSNLVRRRERLDEWTLTLQQHGLDSVEREVDWLSQLINHEIDGTPPSTKIDRQRAGEK